MGFGFTARAWIANSHADLTRERETPTPQLLADVPISAFFISACALIQGDIEQQDIHSRLAEETPLRRFDELLHQFFDFVRAHSAGAGDAGDLKPGGFGTDVRVNPLAEAKTMSAGTTVLVGRLLPLMKAAALFMTLVCNAPLVGPRLLPLEAVMPVGPVP